MAGTIEVDGLDVTPSAEQIRLFNVLTDLQKRVVLNKLKGMNNVQAYWAAGGVSKSENSANSTVSELLNNPNVSASLKSFVVERISPSIMGRDEMLQRLTKMARADVNDVVDVTGAIKDVEDIPPDAREGMAGIKITKEGVVVTMVDPLTAIKRIAEMQGYDAPIAIKADVTQRKGLSDFYGNK